MFDTFRKNDWFHFMCSKSPDFDERVFYFDEGNPSAKQKLLINLITRLIFSAEFRIISEAIIVLSFGSY